MAHLIPQFLETSILSEKDRLLGTDASEGTYSLIPLEIWIKIFEKFEPFELTKTACVSRHFKIVCQHNFLWEKFLLRDFAIYNPINCGGRTLSLDRERIKCIVLNYMESHHQERINILNYQQRCERKIINGYLHVTYWNEDTDDTFCEKYGEVDQIESHLRGNRFRYSLFQKIPAGTLSSPASNSFYELYIQTLQKILTLPEAKEIQSYRTTPLLINQYIWSYYKPSYEKTDIPRLNFIRVFGREDGETFRNYYRLLGVFRKSVAGHISKIKEYQTQIPGLSKTAYFLIGVYASALICFLTYMSGVAFDACIKLGKRVSAVR